MSLLQRFADAVPDPSHLHVVCNAFLVVTGIRVGAVLEMESMKLKQKDALYALLSSEFPQVRIIQWLWDYEWILMQQSAFEALTTDERALLMMEKRREFPKAHNEVLGKCIGYPPLPDSDTPGQKCARVHVGWKEKCGNPIIHTFIDGNTTGKRRRTRLML